MAEERNLATARATDADTTNITDTDSTKADLQRRMEEARESISQTVSDIKDTVTNQYQSVKESVNDALDWREQVRRHPAAWSAGALTAGVLVGYGVGAVLMGGDSDYERDYRAYDEDDSDDDANSSSSARYASYEGGRNYGSSRDSSTRSYAGTVGAGASSAYARSSSDTDYRPSYSSGYAGAHDDEDSDKPGLIEKFKGTQAFDRLQTEVSALGDRFIDEISSVGQNVVLPALLGKVKELFGVDLSNKSGGSQQRQSTAAGTSAYGSASSGNSSAQSQSAHGSSAGTGGSGSYGTSENTDYNTTSRDRDEYERGGSSSDRTNQ